MIIERWTWESGTRPCRLSLSFELGAVFADFDVDASTGEVYLVRISFDGYGCCRADSDIGRMSLADSKLLLANAEGGPDELAALEPLLRRYFRANEAHLWKDALEEHKLL